MKLKTVPALFGKSMKVWDDHEIKFDSSGVVEVKDDLGKKLLERYPELVFDENFEAAAPKTREQEFTAKVVDQLNEEIFSLNDQLKSKNQEIELVIADKEAWQEKVGELVKERDEAVEQLGKEKLSAAGEIKLLKLKIELLTSSVTNMQKMCEMSGYPKTDWVNLSKEKMIEYILGKAK